MCGRFTFTWYEWRQVADRLGIDDEGDAAASYRPRFNIAPTDQHFIVTSEFERRKAQYARWGLVNHWATDTLFEGFCLRVDARMGARSERPAPAALDPSSRRRPIAIRRLV